MKKQPLSIGLVKNLKQQILKTRYAVAKLANAEMLHLYFSVGKMVDDEFVKNKWGAKVNNEIAALLQQELPGLRGFYGSNIRKMRLFYQEWKCSSLFCPTLSDKLDSSDDSILPTLSDKIENGEEEFWSTVSTKMHRMISLY